MKKLFKSISSYSLVGFVISTILLWLLLKQSSLEWQQLGTYLYQEKAILFIIPAMLLFVLMVLIQAFRIRLIFVDTRTSIHDISAYPSLAIGNLYNCLLPGNLGEAVRAWHFSKKNNKPFTATIALFVTEKVFDALLCLPLFAFAFVLFPFKQHYIQYTFLVVTLAVILACIILMVLLGSKKYRSIAFKIIPVQWLRKFLFRILFHFQSHYQRMLKNKTLKYFVMLSYGMFVMNLFQYYLILKSVQIASPVLGFDSAYILSLSMIIIAFIPSAPGNVGVAHYGVYLALLFLAELKSVEVSHIMQQKYAIAGIFLHFSYFIPEILIGLFYLLKEHKTVFQFTSVKI